MRTRTGLFGTPARLSDLLSVHQPYGLTSDHYAVLLEHVDRLWREAGRPLPEGPWWNYAVLEEGARHAR